MERIFAEEGIFGGSDVGGNMVGVLVILQLAFGPTEVAKGIKRTVDIFCPHRDCPTPTTCPAGKWCGAVGARHWHDAIVCVGLVALGLGDLPVAATGHGCLPCPEIVIG